MGQPVVQFLRVKEFKIIAFGFLNSVDGTTCNSVPQGKRIQNNFFWILELCGWDR